jgi:hypothetical protein
MYSKQKIFCNICGKLFDIQYTKMLGRNCKVCSPECLDEYNWRDILSNMNQEYYVKGTKKDD